MTKPGHVAAILALLVTSCGGTLKVADQDSDTGTDSGTDVSLDTGTDTVEDVPPDIHVDTPEDTALDIAPDDPGPACDNDLGDWTPGETYAGIGWGGGYWIQTGSIGPTFWPPPISEVVIEAFPEYDGPGAPGTYTVDSMVMGDSCLLCIWLFEECNNWWSECNHYYLADTATLTIDAIDRRPDGRITGSLSGVYFIEVNEDGTSVIEDGLSYCLDVWEFSDIFDRMG